MISFYSIFAFPNRYGNCASKSITIFNESYTNLSLVQFLPGDKVYLVALIFKMLTTWNERCLAFSTLLQIIQKCRLNLPKIISRKRATCLLIINLFYIFNGIFRPETFNSLFNRLNESGCLVVAMQVEKYSVIAFTSFYRNIMCQGRDYLKWTNHIFYRMYSTSMMMMLCIRLETNFVFSNFKWDKYKENMTKKDTHTHKVWQAHTHTRCMEYWLKKSVRTVQ